MFSGNFGLESEMRSAQQHPTGRRHHPREMTDSAGVPTYYSNEARQASEARATERALRETNATKGPSFMDHMYANDPAPDSDPVARKVQGPRDQLNLFAWDAPTAGGAQTRARGRAQPSSHVSDGVNVPDAQALRAAESRKFERNTESHFLRFGADGGESTPHTGRRVSDTQREGATAAFGSPQHGMMDSLLRNETTGRLSKRRGPEPRRANGPAVQGFPGMGQSSAHKPFAHLPRKPVASNVFLPQLPSETTEPTAPAPPQRAHPQYRHGDDDDTNAAHCYHYSPAKGILPGPDDRGADSPGAVTRPEWMPKSHLEQGEAGLTPQLDDDAAPRSQRRHVDFDEQHAHLEQASPQRRTMLFKMRHQE